MQNKLIGMVGYSWVLLAGLGLGCSAQADDKEGPLSMEALDLQGQSFDDIIPADHHTSVTIVGKGSASDRLADREAPSNTTDLEARQAGAVIDAQGARAYFPMPRNKRSFRTKTDLIQFVVDKFGADEVVTDPQTGEIVSARGSYVQRGVSLFEDTELGVKFHVREPILAYVGGVSGVVEVAGQDACLDPDGECGSERASYLDLEGEETKPTHVNRCGGNPVYCAQFHSFFNKVPWPVYWARHGTNVQITSGPIVQGNQLAASGSIFSDFRFWPMPSVSNGGQGSIETAVWSIGSGAALEYMATAVCGTSFAAGIGAFATGNGPENVMRCGN